MEYYYYFHFADEETEVKGKWLDQGYTATEQLSYGARIGYGLVCRVRVLTTKRCS